MASQYNIKNREIARWQDSVETVVKTIALAVARRHGSDFAKNLIPTIADAVAQALAEEHSVTTSNNGIPYFKEAMEIVRAGRILGDLGMVSGASGNISVLLDDGTVLITPSGKRKGELRPEEMVNVDLSGKILSDGPQKASSEMKIHLQAYRSRSDIRAVVHTHPPYATTFAAAHMPLDNTVLAEAWNLLGGPVPVVPFGAPSTPSLADNLIPYLPKHSSFLLANHGAMTIAKNLELAVQMTETLEFLARVQLNARAIGGECPLRSGDIAIMREVEARRNKG